MINIYHLSLFAILFQATAMMVDFGEIVCPISGDECYQGGYTARTIYFNKVFQNPPQVMLFQKTYDIWTPVDYYFTVGNITTTSFDYLVDCFFNDVSGYGFFWRAIDDYRVTVINSFNNVVAGLGSITFTFNYNNPFVTQGVVSTLNLGFTDAFYFSLDIQSLTSNQVIVSLTQNTTNLLTIGFQVILTASQYYYLEAPVTLYNLVLTYPEYIYIQVPLQSDHDLFIITKSINDPHNPDGTHIEYTITQFDANTVSYNARAWLDCVITSLTYQVIWINSIVFEPLFLQKMRQSRKFSIDLPMSYLSIYIQELDQTYESSGSFTIPISKINQVLNLQITIHCYTDLYVLGSILQQIHPTVNYQNIEQNCYPQINSLIYYIKLKQKEYIDQEIQLTLATQSLTIYQSDIEITGQTNFTVLSIGLQSSLGR